MTTKLNQHAGALALAALVVAILGATVAGAGAARVFITSKQIKNGTVTTKDLKNSGIRSVDVRNGTIDSADIGTGEVEPVDVTMPAPDQLQETDAASATVGTDFALVDTVGTYAKDDPTSDLEVTWTGTAVGIEVPCVFQLRVDGNPSAAGAGATFVGTSVESVAAASLFSGLASGNHTVEIWAKLTHGPGTAGCVVGPASAGIEQTFVVAEQVA